TQWLNFGAPQWDPKSPWHDKRVRLAAALAFDKDGINQAETLGFSRPTGSIIPSAYEYALAIPAYPYDPARAKKLLAEAGYPNGFDAEYAADNSYGSVAEAIGNYLGAVGIRTTLGAGLPERRRSPRRGGGARADRAAPLLGAVRGSQAQEVIAPAICRAQLETK